jgi:hypothetical protein
LAKKILEFILWIITKVLVSLPISVDLPLCLFGKRNLEGINSSFDNALTMAKS